MIRVGGQCEGYGGIFLALAEHLDVEHAWYAEVDQAASRVLAQHFPGVPNHGDITVFDWASADRVDVMTAGWPCQPFSLAGKRQGSDDDRHLWPTGVLPAVRELMPHLFVGENVAGLLTIDGGQVFARVLADLDDLGYTVSWTTVGACKVGACHHRHRVFIAATLAEVRVPMSDPVAHRAGDGWVPGQAVLFGDVESVRWPASGFTAAGIVWELPVDTCGLDGVAQLLPTPRTSDTNGAGVHGSGGLDLRTAVSMFPTPTARDASRGAGRPEPEGRPLSEVIALLPTPRAIDGTSGQQTLVDGRTAGDRGPRLSDLPSLLPTPVASDADRVSSSYSRGNPTLLGAMLPTPRASDAVKGGPNQRGSSGDVMLPAAVQPERFGSYAAAVYRHERAYGLVAPDPTQPGRLGRPRLAPAFPEWMQGLPPGWLTDHVGRKDAIRLAGNGVNGRQAAYALGTLPTFRAAVAALREPVLT